MGRDRPIRQLRNSALLRRLSSTLWGIPFVIMGQYLIWGRFLYTAWKKGRTYYAVTNKRVIVVSIGFSRKLIDGYLRNLDSASLTLRSDGIGTIEFASAPLALSNWSFGRSYRGNQIDIDLSSLAFFDIPDARTVYQLIQSQREQATKPATERVRLLRASALSFLREPTRPKCPRRNPPFVSILLNPPAQSPSDQPDANALLHDLTAGFDSPGPADHPPRRRIHQVSLPNPRRLLQPDVGLGRLLHRPPLG